MTSSKAFTVTSKVISKGISANTLDDIPITKTRNTIKAQVKDIQNTSILSNETLPKETKDHSCQSNVSPRLTLHPSSQMVLDEPSRNDTPQQVSFDHYTVFFDSYFYSRLNSR